MNLFPWRQVVLVTGEAFGAADGPPPTQDIVLLRSEAACARLAPERGWAHLEITFLRDAR